MRQSDGLSVITLSHLIKLSQSYQAIISQQAVLILSYSISSIYPHTVITTSSSPFLSHYSISFSSSSPYPVLSSCCSHRIKLFYHTKLSPSSHYDQIKLSLSYQIMKNHQAVPILLNHSITPSCPHPITLSSY